jgi:PAS domain S-box-containing protein
MLRQLGRVSEARDPLSVFDQRTLELLPVPAYVCSADGTIVGYNAKAVELWGRSPPRARKLLFCGAICRYSADGRRLARAETPVANVLRSGRPATNQELLIEQPSGRRIRLLANVSPIPSETGELAGAISCFSEVDGQRPADAELVRKYDELDDFFENGAVGLHIVASNGRIVRANRAELDLLGYTADEYIGRHIGEFHADGPTITDIIARLKSGETIHKYPARLRAKDGSIKHVMISSSGHFQDGRLTHTRCFTVDVTALHAADKAARDNQRRLEATYEAVPVGVAEVDQQGRFLRVNNAFTHITGFSEVDLCKSTFLDLTHPDDRENDRSDYARQVNGDIDHYTKQKRYIRKDGAAIFVEVLSSSVRDEDGRFLYGVRAVQDVSERRRAQIRLEESERRTKEILDALPTAVYTTDAEGRVTYFNEAAVAFAGRRPELGDKWCIAWKLYHPDGSPLPHDACPMAVSLREKRAVRGVEAIAERPDGSRIPFIPYPTPLFDASGAMTGAINVLVDITAHKQSYDLMQRLAAIVDSSQDAIISKDLNSTIETWNRGAEQLFGYTAEEAIGKPITILIPPVLQDEEAVIIGRIRQGEGVHHYETVRQHKDGRLLDISLTVSPIRDASGRIVGASKIARDITQRKQAEERQQLLINELNHRVKNTLAVVQSLARQSLGRDADGPAYARFEARLVTLSRAHDLLTQENWEGADMQEVVTRTLAPHCANEDRLHVSGQALRVSPGMALSLSMALHELCTNAVKHGALSNPSGRVSVAWSVDEVDGMPHLTLRWREFGGPKVKKPATSGFGTRLLERGLARELDASVQIAFKPSGLVCIILAPLRDPQPSSHSVEIPDGTPSNLKTISDR